MDTSGTQLFGIKRGSGARLRPHTRARALGRGRAGTVQKLALEETSDHVEGHARSRASALSSCSGSLFAEKASVWSVSAGPGQAQLLRGQDLTHPSSPGASGRACGQGQLPRRLPRVPCRQTAQPRGLMPGEHCVRRRSSPGPATASSPASWGAGGPVVLDALAALEAGQHTSRPSPPPPNAPQGPQTPVEEPVWSALQNHVNSELWGDSVNANADSYYRKQ